jgi:hypothetical protein
MAHNRQTLREQLGLKTLMGQVLGQQTPDI